MTRRLPPRPGPPRPEDLFRVNRIMRRVVVGGLVGIGAALAGLVIGIPFMFPDAQPSQRFSNRRIIPPLLRARMDLRQPHGREASQRGTPPGELPPEEALLVLTRAEMRDLGAPTDSPAPREALEVTAYLADDIWYSARTLVAVVAPGGAPDATLIAAQGETVWVWADQLAAAGPGYMGRTLDAAALLRLNPDLGLDRPGLRRRLRLAEALILDGTPAGPEGWAFDPATRIATRRAEPRAAPWPPLYPASPQTGPAIAREGRLGATWFGLLPEDMTITAAVSAQESGGAFLPPMPEDSPARLWRGRVRSATAGDNAPPAATDILEAAEPVPGFELLPAGGLVMAGPNRLLGLADPPSILLAQIGRATPLRESLRRLQLDGTPVWEVELPTTEQIRTALLEPGRLWLLASPPGMSETLHAIAPADGRIIRTRHVA